jgi:ActR/RegA family two-component response regulator
MELFEQIRREYEHGAGTIRAVARKLGIHRRMVRQALATLSLLTAREPNERSRNWVQ